MQEVKKIGISTVVVVAIVALTYPEPSYAYLDPGTGSLVIQILIAGFAGAAFGIKMFWARIKEFFKSKTKS